MQQIKCSRSLLTCWLPAAQSFSSATSIMYRNDKDWDFKANPTSLVMDPLQRKPFVQGYNQRKREYGMRTLVNLSMGGEDSLDREDVLNHLKGIINSDQKSKEPILFDGSTKKQVHSEVLKMKNLLLFFSKLEIPGRVLDDFIHPVHKKLQQERKEDVIVWIPVEYNCKHWDQKTFEDYSQKMPWYTFNCFPASKDKMKSVWNFTEKPMLTVVNKIGTVQETDALQLIKKKGVDAFFREYIN